MADPVSGFALLGNALGGTSEKSYQEGLALGANTQNALAQARARVDENTAKQGLADVLGKLPGISPDVAAAVSTTLRAGGNPTDALLVMLKNQEYGFRAKAGDPNVPVDQGNRALLGVASGPVEQFYQVGGGYADKFNSGAGITPLGDALGGEGGGSAAGMQYARSLGLVDARDRVIPGKEADFYDVVHPTGRLVNEGGVPGRTDFNPYRRPGAVPTAAPPAPGVAPPAAAPPAAPALTPLSDAARVGANEAEIERQKTIGRERGQQFAQLPQAQATLRNQTINADAVISQIDKALGTTDWWSAGPAGYALRGLAWTDAGSLQRAVDVIKANTGFQQLQQMRSENATGAGLGQIAVQELTYLQAALGNLDTAQDADELAKALNEVKRRYSGFKKAMEQDFKNKVSFATGGAPIPGLGPQHVAPAAPAAAAPAAAPAAGDFSNLWNGG